MKTIFSVTLKIIVSFIATILFMFIFIQSLFFIRKHELISRAVQYVGSIKIEIPEVEIPKIDMPEVKLPDVSKFIETLAIKNNEPATISTYENLDKELFYDIKYQVLKNNDSFNIKCELSESVCSEKIDYYLSHMQTFVPFIHHYEAYSIKNRGGVYEVSIEQYDNEQFQTLVKRISSDFNQLIKLDDNQYDTLLKIHDYIIENFEHTEKSSIENMLINQEGDSKSYALMFQYLASEYNYSVDVINNGDDYFNIVEINGEQFIVDVSKDDVTFVNQNSRIIYDYFLKKADDLVWSNINQSYDIPEYYQFMLFN